MNPCLCTVGLTLLFAISTALAESASNGAPGAIVKMTGPKSDSPTAGIQDAVDALPRNGGMVKLPPGQYLLRQSIRLRSNVMFEGAGTNTILRKPKHAESRLAAVAQQGSRSVQVLDASRFSAGDQVTIRDREAMGWNVVQAIITEVKGNELVLDRRLPRTCDSAKMGFVIHVFPALTADHASGIVIKNLAIQDDARRDLSLYGPLDNPRARWAIVLPFHVAAIHFNGVSDSRVERCSVTGWLSDGISVQGGSVKGPSSGNDVVVDCVVQNCGGIGLHPGGGLHDSLFSHNLSRGNGSDGLYFCAGVTRVTVSGNQLIGNQGNGVGGLGDYDDRFNLVTNNVCAENGLDGILMCDGDHNTVAGNTCRNNSQAVPGQYSGIEMANTSASVVIGNRCFDDQEKKTQKHGIEELADCRTNTIASNNCQGNLQLDVMLAAAQPQPASVTRRRAASLVAGSARSEAAEAAPGERVRAAASPSAQPAAAPVRVGPPKIVDFADPTYGTKVRQLRKDDGHEHNFYYYREPWNADGSRLLGIQSSLDQQDWRVCLYEGNGRFIKELFPITKYDWRLCWDRRDPNLLHAYKGADLFRLNVGTGQVVVLKSFKPEWVHWTGPSINQDGDRILVVTTDNKSERTFRSYHLPDMSDERSFQITAPPGCQISWDKVHFTGCKNYIDTAYTSADRSLSEQGIVVYDDTGKKIHTFEGLGGGGHYDWSPDGKLAYFKMHLAARNPGGPRPLEIHVVNLDGTDDRVLFSVPRDKAIAIQNLHLSWPKRVNDWFIASLIPYAEHLPAAQTPDSQAGLPGPLLPNTRAPGAQPNPGRRTLQGDSEPGARRVDRAAAQPALAADAPRDEIVKINLNGSSQYLAHSVTWYGRNMFWAEPLAVVRSDGKRIAFHTRRSGTIDLCILFLDE